MKNRIIDVAWFLEKWVRALFYMGSGIYLAVKAAQIIPYSALPHFLTGPAILIALVGGYLLGGKVIIEPSHRELREAKKKAEATEKILYEMVTDYQARGLDQLFRKEK